MRLLKRLWLFVGRDAVRVVWCVCAAAASRRRFRWRAVDARRASAFSAVVVVVCTCVFMWVAWNKISSRTGELIFLSLALCSTHAMSDALRACTFYFWQILAHGFVLSAEAAGE